jgi:hypothetical protein
MRYIRAGGLFSAAMLVGMLTGTVFREATHGHPILWLPFVSLLVACAYLLTEMVHNLLGDRR